MRRGLAQLLNTRSSLTAPTSHTMRDTHPHDTQSSCQSFIAERAVGTTAGTLLYTATQCNHTAVLPVIEASERHQAKRKRVSQRRFPPHTLPCASMGTLQGSQGTHGPPKPRQTPCNQTRRGWSFDNGFRIERASTHAPVEGTLEQTRTTDPPPPHTHTHTH